MTEPLPITYRSRICPIPTSAKMSTFRQMPLKPIADDSFLSETAHSTPVM